ncbi:NHL repeat-containing protein 2 [Hordeum vulgare]|nr:NHL repeat-containing protein 2 [Hordeum vulgare]
MTADREALWESLPPVVKHGVAALVAAWQSHRARRMEVGLPASSPEVSDDENGTTMETGSDDTALAPMPPVNSGYTMEQVQTRYNTVMAEGQHASTCASMLEQALEQHRLALV